MRLDLALLLLVVLFGAQGWRTGAIDQVQHWTGLIVGGLSARPLANRLTPLLTPHVRAPAVLLNVGLSSVCFLVVGALASEAVRLALKRRDWPESRGDRVAGAALGTAKGAGLLYLMLSVAVYFGKPLFEACGMPAVWDSSWTVGLARRHDLLAAMPGPAESRLKLLAAAAKDPKSITVDPAVKQLLDDPKLKELLSDKELERALATGDYSKLKDDPRLKALLSDPRLAGGS